MKLDAILWDYDGTLVNSVPKNIDITKKILSIVAPHLTENNLPIYLQSESAYHEANHSAKNWQELYQKFYGLTENETLVAGNLWTEHQVNNSTPVELYSGIKYVIEYLSSLPHGICSQNSSLNIWKVIKEANIHHAFKSVIGYTDVANNAQKPCADSGIKCLSEIFDDISNKTVFYIGDHEADVQFARNLDEKLGSNSTVLSVAVTYSGSTPENWHHQPDYMLNHPENLLEICNLYD